MTAFTTRGSAAPEKILLVEFSVKGNPRVKKRPRVLRSGRTYTPKVSVDAELEVAWEARAAMAGKRVPTVPLRVRVDFFMTTARRSDIDNLAKCVLDAGNGVLWADDSQIGHLTLTRSVDRSEPRTEVRVWLAEEAA